MRRSGGSPAPKVTVISGYYNRSETAVESVRSILDQTFEDFEFIIFDDASTDRTLEVLQSFDDPRIRLIEHRKNIGFVNGMIQAVSQAQGDIIAVHGSGDISHPERLARQVYVFERNSEVGVVGCYRQTIDMAGHVVSVVRPKVTDLTFDKLLKANRFSHGEVAFRKSFYQEAGGYRREFVYSQDRDLWLRMVKVSKIDLVPKILYSRRVDPSGVSFNPTKAVRQAKYSFLSEVLAVLPQEEQHAVLAEVRAQGIDSVIATSEPRIQRQILKKIFSLGAVGEWDGAAQFLAKLQPTSFANALRYIVGNAFYRLGSALDPQGKFLTRLIRLSTRGTS